MKDITHIAMTVIPESGRISPMYDTAAHLLVVDRRRRNVMPLESIPFPPGREARRSLLVNHDVNLLITGAISNEDIADLQDLGLQVCPFVSGIWDDVLMAWYQRHGVLPTGYLMPWCGHQHRQFGGGRFVDGGVPGSGCHRRHHNGQGPNFGRGAGGGSGQGYGRSRGWAPGTGNGRGLWTVLGRRNGPAEVRTDKV